MPRSVDARSPNGALTNVDGTRRGGLAAPFQVPALDGLRAVAFLIVFANHAVPRSLPILGPLATSGWCGVDLFFTLSGFLVTYLLLREEAKNDAGSAPPRPDRARFSLMRFWARRSLRIWPLYYAALLIGLVILPRLPGAWTLGPAAGSASHEELVGTYALPSSFFLFNWAMVAHGWHASFSFNTLWSISVEEQFYVLWPLALWLIPRGHRRAVIVGGILVAIGVRTTLMAQGLGDGAVYVHTFLRADALLGGALLAQIVAARNGKVPTPPRWLAPAVIVAYGLHASLGESGKLPGVVTSLRYVLIDAIAVSSVWLCLAPGLWQRLLAAAPLTFLGRISYGLYVWHFVTLAAIGVALADLRDGSHTGLFHAARVPLSLLATVALAWLTFTFFERPFLKLKERFTS